MTKIKFNEPFLTGLELEYISQVFSSQQFSGPGSFFDDCVNEIRAETGCDRIVLTDSCTSALEISALLMRDWDSEQEVIVPSYTFPSTAAAFVKFGYRVRFCEVNPNTLNLDLDSVKSNINKNTSAVVSVHYGGLPGEIVALTELCSLHGIKLVEDAAQGYGAKLHDKSLGTYGDFGCFSFHETKNIHAGLSGALCIKDDNYYKRATSILERGTNRQELLKGIVNKYTWVEIGGSYAPTELQAAFLLPQLRAMSKNHQERSRIFEVYREVFQDTDLVSIASAMPGNFSHNWHSFWLQFPSEDLANFVREKMLLDGIQLYIGYVPLHSSPVGVKLGYTEADLPTTEKVAKLILRLPLHNQMTPKDASRVSEKILHLLDKY